MKRWHKAAITFGATAIIGTGGTVAVDKQIDPYVDKGTHYELPITSDIPQGERVEIAKDKAQMTLKGWNDEYAITITPIVPTAPSFGATTGAVDQVFDVQAARPLLSKQMQFKSGDVTAFIQPKEGTTDQFDIDFTLDAKPDTNVFEYKIEGAEDFDFFYQAPLWQEAGLKAPIADCTDTECNIGNEGTTMRPNNVVGSYAVYSKTKANHRLSSTNYATGKVAHIFRPKATDANGNEVWATLDYSNGVLSVTVPQDFLDGAMYPVKIDPTIGYSTQGGTEFEITADLLAASTQNAAASYNGTVSSMSFYGKTETNTRGATFAVYDTSSNLLSPQSSEISITSTTAQWWTQTFTGPSITSGTSYWPAVFMDFVSSTDNIHVYRDAAASGDTKVQNSTYPTFPNPATFTNSSNKYSVYATYDISLPDRPSGTQVILESSSGSGNQTWVVPADFTAVNTIECIGAGGNGGNATTGQGGGGGGGGAYAKITNLSLTPGASVTFSIGGNATTTAGTMANETYFNGSASSSASISCAFGKRGTDAGAGGAGGTTANSTGSTEYAGGTGGTSGGGTAKGGSGGGGSAGDTGAGANGGNANLTSSMTGAGGGGSNGGTAGQNTSSGGIAGNGGNGYNGTGGAVTINNQAGVAGTAGTGGGGSGGDDGVSPSPGGAGAKDDRFDSTHGAGGGGGGGSPGSNSLNGDNGGAGGTYGGGAGGGAADVSGGNNGGTGGQGIIVITYTAAAPTGGSATPPQVIWWEE